MFHLGWFVGRGFGLPTWGRTWTGNVDVRDWLSGQYFVDWARSLERAGFDFIMFADTAYVPDTYGGSAEAYLRNGHMTPMHDPAALIPVLGYTTRHIGLVSTLSTSFYHPYGLARLAGTLDNMTGGRFGWNIVTTSSHQAAACFGVDLPEHDARYDIADEFVELAERLWASWEPDSVVADEKAGMYVDHTKVRPVDFVGRYYRSTGPLNIQPPPQGRPVYVQAGGSTRGIRFAATHAEAIVCMAKGVDNMKRYRDDVRAHAAAAGRDPDTVKVLFLLDPVMGETRHEVEARIEIRDRSRTEGLDGLLTMAGYSATGGFDIANIDLDEPLVNHRREDGHLAVLEQMLAVGPTLRDVLPTLDMSVMDIAGTPDEVAGQMSEVIEEVGGDGFLIGGWDFTRRRIAEIADGLAPALRRRGVMRDGYAHRTLRDHLLEY
ncbi:MAG: NtaA/DmoA family FMN-dependent monooxygenase [Actinobacteria bacterium]|nr:NtaA/DmoA family FMN-dependent monooxygenase [Actinomycetota bacterium]